jgi:hypothetical protein
MGRQAAGGEESTTPPKHSLDGAPGVRRRRDCNPTLATKAKAWRGWGTLQDPHKEGWR